MSKGIKWRYEQEPDVYLNGKKMFNWIKLLVILLISLFLIGLGTLGYIFRYYLLDKLVNPQIVLSQDEIEIEVGESFDCKSLVNEEEYDKRYEIIYPDMTQIDIKKLGDYELKYLLKSQYIENESIAILHVIDKTPPQLTLKETEISIRRGEEAEKFNPKDYIENISDNYYKPNEINIEYDKIFNWTKDTLEVKYVATDPSGNIDIKTLKINVEAEKVERLKLIYLAGEEILEEVEIESTEFDNNNINIDTYKKEFEGYSFDSYDMSKNELETEILHTLRYTYVKNKEEVKEDAEEEMTEEQSSSNQNNETDSSQNYTPPQPARGHYIDGLRNITLKKGTSFDKLIAELQYGILSDEEVRIMYGDITEDSLNTPGTYPVLYETDHVSKIIYVTIVE